MPSLSQTIFKAYDIRGVVGKTLNVTVARQIGQAFGSAVLERGERTVVIGRDGRLSGPDLTVSLAMGLQESGVDVIDIGMVATPMLYFATHILNARSGIMVTGSHNPRDHNGFKMVLSGEAIYGEAIQSLYLSIVNNCFTGGSGTYVTDNILGRYQQRIVSDVTLSRPIHIAIDCGNGVAGAFAGALYRAMGCTVTELFCQVDGTFPNHHPDPAHPENLRDLIECVRTTDAEIGLAFDGDGDRLGVVTKTGNIIYPDRQLMLFAQEVLSRHAGAEIIYDVKCTQHMAKWIKKYGGVPRMWKTGHSLVKAKMRETGALLGGEMSGHIFFKDRWYGFDDGLYAGARILELLSQHPDVSLVLDALPESMSTPELQIPMEEGESVNVINKIRQKAQFFGAERVIIIDGVRVEYSDGFGLIRASNTTPVLVLRFEGVSQGALSRIQGEFRRVILAAKPDAVLPF